MKTYWLRTAALSLLGMLSGLGGVSAQDSAAAEGADGSPEEIEVQVDDITVRINGHSGKFTFWHAKQDEGRKKFKVEMNGIFEQTADGVKVTSHTFDTFANQDFSFTELFDDEFAAFEPGETIAAKRIDFFVPLHVQLTTGTLAGPLFSHLDLDSEQVDLLLDETRLSTLTLQTYLFTEAGSIDLDGEEFDVEAGYLKFNVEIWNWPFESASNELVLEMAVKTPSLTPTRVGDAVDMGDAGFLILSGSGLVDVTNADPNGELVDVDVVFNSDEGSVGRLFFEFPFFETNIFYDPIVGSDFDREIPLNTLGQVNFASSGLANWKSSDFGSAGSAGWEAGEGLCIFVPDNGENLIQWESSDSQFIDLAKNTAYRIRVTMSTDQNDPGEIPIWNILYANDHSDQGILTWGGERWFYDNAGGANGIGQVGRDGLTQFEAWAVPAAALTAQWNGDVDAANGAFSALNEPFNDFGVAFRVIDFDSAAGGSLGSQFDDGTICLKSIEVQAVGLDSLVTDGGPLFGSPGGLNANIEVLFASDGGAAIKNDAGDLTVEVGETGGFGRTLVGYQDSSLAGFPRLFPVLWSDGELLRLTAEIVDPRASSGPNPVDVIGLGWEAATDEIGGTDFISRGAAGGVFDRSASPRSIIETGGEAQKYISLFYTHNSTDADPTALPDGNRLRAVLDFFNRPDIAGSLGEGQRSDPLQIRSFVVERVTVGGGD